MKKKRRENAGKLIPIEKSRRVIRLERRGRETERSPVSAKVASAAGGVCILYCGGIAAAGFGSYFFLIWGGLGAAGLLLGALLRNRRLMDAIPVWCKVFCGGIVGLGILLFCGVEGLIFTQFNADAAPGADFCIVLGAQWKAGGPSEALRKRLDKAILYLRANPDTKVIVSGGQGSNEPIPEASGMREYLIGAGIDSERILVEDQSANTYENLVFSRELLDPRSDSVVIVTSNFHVFRALSIAEKQGYRNAAGLAADSLPAMAPNNLLREFFGVVKDYVKGNL